MEDRAFHSRRNFLLGRFACAESCPEPVFTDARPKQEAFPHLVAIGESCLAWRGVVCQCCADACPEVVISFPARLGAPAAPIVDNGICTGCGACISACPVGAIGIARHGGEHTGA